LLEFVCYWGGGVAQKHRDTLIQIGALHVTLLFHQEALNTAEGRKCRSYDVGGMAKL
jgi:hypothetical protein